MYTYLIGWRELDTWYYGVRTANTKPPSEDLWNDYFTSSKYVKEFRKLHGEPDVIRVHKVFDDKESALEFEERFLDRVNAVKTTRWLNRGNAGKKFENSISHNKGIPRTEETKEKIRKSLIGKKPSKQALENQSRATKGKKQSAEHVAARRKALVGRSAGFSGKKHSPETKEKMRLSRLAHFEKNGKRTGWEHSPETKQKMSESRKTYFERLKNAESTNSIP